MNRNLPLPDIALHAKYEIDIDNPMHVAWWAGKLSVSEPALVAAVHEVGFSALEVFCYLRGVSTAEASQQRWSEPRPMRDVAHAAASRPHTVYSVPPSLVKERRQQDRRRMP